MVYLLLVADLEVGSQIGFKKMFNSRRRFFSKELIRLAGSNKIDEEKLIARIHNSYKPIAKIDELLDSRRTKDEYKGDSEVAKQFKAFRYGIKDLLFVLDGLFFNVSGKEHIELNWAKAYADSFDKTCEHLLSLLDDATFLDPILNEAHENREKAEKDIEQLRQCIRIINYDYGDLQLVRRSEAEEENLWNQYTQDVADPDEEQTLQEQLRELMKYYVEKFGKSGLFEREFMQSGITDPLRGQINRIHARVLMGLEQYLKLSGGSPEKKLSMKSAISSLLGNKNVYKVMKDNKNFQEWLKLLEIFNNYLPST